MQLLLSYPGQHVTDPAVRWFDTMQTEDGGQAELWGKAPMLPLSVHKDYAYAGAFF
jgi:hypothetical protein